MQKQLHKKNQTARSGNLFVRARPSQSNSRLLQILTTKPQPTISEHIYKRLDGWPGLKPLNFSRFKSTSTKLIKREPQTDRAGQSRNKNIKPFGRVTLFGQTLSLIPSGHNTIRHQSTDKLLTHAKKSTELRMDRYQQRRPIQRSVEHVLQDFSAKDQLSKQYKVDFESFNYIDKVIDFKDLWRDFVRKTDRS